MASKRLPVVINAQMIRAILFAKATATTLYGFFARSSAALRVGTVFAWRPKRRTACAPDDEKTGEIGIALFADPSEAILATR